MAMLEVLLYIAVSLLLVGIIVCEWKKTIGLILLALAVFLSLGAYRLSYNGTDYLYAFIPLAFAICGIVYMIYTIYLMVAGDKKDWGDEVDDIEYNENWVKSDKAWD